MRVWSLGTKEGGSPSNAIIILSQNTPNHIARCYCAFTCCGRDNGWAAFNIFSVGAETEPNTTPGSCPLNLLNNPGFELPGQNPVSAPPVIARVSTNPATLWPPNHQMVDVTVSYDIVECAIAETWLSVGSDDPDAASDWEVVDAHHVRLRAKRSPRAGDRVYTITITAKDTQGNLASEKVTVRVPHHK